MIISDISAKISLATPEELAKYNVNILARSYGLSAPNLCRAFQKRIPLKLGWYLRYLKLRAFEKMIKENPDMTVSAALKILDIRSQSHFGEMYKKRRNMTPGDLAVICQIEREQAERSAT